MISRKHFLVAFLAGSALAVMALAQAPAGPATGGRGGRAARTGAGGASGGAARGGRAGGFTQFTRPLAPQDVVARGKTLFEANCASCHASDFRGTAKGVNIVRSGIALRDQHGELIGEELGKHNPPITLVAADNVATAEYIHAVLATAGRQGRPPGADPSGLELTVLVGDVNAGKTYFGAHCSSCHSITGDLKGIGTKYADNPRGLQGDWVSGTGGGGGGGGGRGGRGGGGQQATVTLANGQKVQGTLVKRTDFLVVMMLPDGTRKEWTRTNDVPSVEVVDPQAAHKKMVLEMDDPENKNMHDVTAYLATLK